ncbi:MAG: YceH family protein [Betaproteobacteria bacterium]
MPLPILSPQETRVLGVLVEKQRTVPDTYPLSLNAIVAGCNQKTSRDPLMSVSDAQAQAVIDSLKGLSLVVETSGGRVMRYAHNAERLLALPSQSVAILAVLMLRGPQTAGELRINSDRLHRFADISAVEGFLHELAARAAGALVIELERAPGTRETRWAQLLAGIPAGDAVRATPRDADAPGPPARALAELRDSVAALQDEVAALKAALAQLRTELGGAAPEPSDAT